MKRVLAIARLTFAEGIRMRIVLVFLIVLGFLVLRLPFALRGDETLTGRLQNFLDYSLGAVGMLLSLSTIMLAASTLATEFRTNTLHLVVTKPVGRFHILLGKWLGINLLNLLLLTLCGLAIYGFAALIASRADEATEVDQLKVSDVVWTARAAATPTQPDFVAIAAAEVDQQIRNAHVQPEHREDTIIDRTQELAANWRTIPCGGWQDYRFENLPAQFAEDDANAPILQVQFKVRTSPLPADEQARVGWMFLDPQSDRRLLPRLFTTIEMTGHMHQVLVPAEVVRDGTAKLRVYNLHDLRTGINLKIDGEGKLQLLYKVAPFEDTYVKTLLLILLRLAFLAALGVFFGTFVSFPVAVFCGLTWYIVCVGRPFWDTAIGLNAEMMRPENDPYGYFGPLIRPVLGFFVTNFFPNFQAYSGVRNLVDGLYIQWTTVMTAGGQLLGLAVLLLFLVGWFIFREREVAEVTV